MLVLLDAQAEAAAVDSGQAQDVQHEDVPYVLIYATVGNSCPLHRQDRPCPAHEQSITIKIRTLLKHAAHSSVAIVRRGRVASAGGAVCPAAGAAEPGRTPQAGGSGPPGHHPQHPCRGAALLPQASAPARSGAPYIQLGSQSMQQ